MAFLIKRTQRANAGGAGQGSAVIDQWVQVSCPARTLPATTTDQIFRVRGGRVLVRTLLGEVTTVCSATVTTVTVTSKKLTDASAAVGTAVSLATAGAVTSLEVGANLLVGAAAALTLSNAGGTIAATMDKQLILPQGEVYITTSATNTGATKWDMWYMPLDAGAFVEPVLTATVAI